MPMKDTHVPDKVLPAGKDKEDELQEAKEHKAKGARSKAAASGPNKMAPRGCDKEATK
jgi:hypothetical protein